jgi:ABC-type antimicrobial peptide transport system permease subunit
MRVAAIFAALLALLALVLTLAGLYGMVSYLTSQRTKEIAVRISLGATAGSIAQLVATDAIRLSIAGAVVGCGGAYASAQLLRRLLFDVAPTDWASFTVAAICLTVVTALAAWLPARRAARLDPLPALRGD